MAEEETTSHLVSYPDIKEPQKPLTEKHASPRKAAVLNFNPDGSLCIPADLKEKLVHHPTKGNTSNRQSKCYDFNILDVLVDAFARL